MSYSRHEESEKLLIRKQLYFLESNFKLNQLNEDFQKRLTLNKCQNILKFQGIILKRSWKIVVKFIFKYTLKRKVEYIGCSN